MSGRRKGPIDPGTVMSYATRIGWRFLPLTAQHAATALQQPVAHKDPFDELLLVQAQQEGMRLLTRDEKLLHHPCPVLDELAQRTE